MNRRDACRVLGAVAVSAFAPAASAASTPAVSRARLERIGLQLYTVRELLEEDFEGTLTAVAEVGYREVELAGSFGRTPAQIRAITGQLGLDPVAAHVSLERLREDADGAVGDAAEGGQRFVVLPSLPRRERELDGYRRLADEMNDLGAVCRDAGLRFAYHNHDYELEPVGGTRPYELLLERTDPELVDFEIDVYWAVRGGLDPLQAFARWPGRFRLCHLKDMAPDGGMADVGSGTLDIVGVLDHAGGAGLRHFFVEHDRPGDALASIRASYRYLSGL